VASVQRAFSEVAINTILQVGNIKFITRNEGGQTAPLETMSAAENRIYVTVNKFNQIKAITQYDENGMRVNEIHLHPHGGMSPHSHPGMTTPKSG